MNSMRLGRRLLCAGSLLALGGAARAWADGACCTQSACQNVATEAACNTLGGVYLDGADCADNACGPGACCAPGSCAIAAAFPCITDGREFGGVGTTCFDDPCEDGVGACCNNGACALQSPEVCAADGGVWMGAGTNCVNNQCTIGACCLPGDCETLAIYQCSAVGGEFLGAGGCSEGVCVLNDDCPADALVGQSPLGPDDLYAFTSEFASGFIRYDNFVGAPGPIIELRWFGLDLQPVGNGFTECVETDNTFVINFYEDAGGVPGVSVCSHLIQVTNMPLDEPLEDVVVYEYHLVLPQPCALSSGWISIAGFGDPFCWFLWMGSPDGDDFSLCDNCSTYVQMLDVSFCLEGPAAEAGDLDFDGNVDLTDAATFAGCLLGPGISPNAVCSFADLQADLDVDLRDARDWTNAFSGQP